MHQFPAGHIQECLHCCEGLTVQLDSWALNYSRHKWEEKRIMRKLCECTQKFFHSFKAFPGWLYLWKGNQVKHDKRVAEMPCSPSGIHRHNLCNILIFPPARAPQHPFCLVCIQVSPHPFLLCWLGLDRPNFYAKEEQIRLLQTGQLMFVRVKVFPRMDCLLGLSPLGLARFRA